MLDYLLLFASAFVSATLLPFYSEAYLVSLLQKHPTALLLLVATTGNTAGALLNWWLGRQLLRFQNRKWFYFKPDRIQAAQTRFNRFGLWTLLFAWLPIVGDPLTLVAGVMKVHWLPFTLLVAAGKCARYGFIAYLGLDLMPS